VSTIIITAHEAKHLLGKRRVIAPIDNALEGLDARDRYAKSYDLLVGYPAKSVCIRIHRTAHGPGKDSMGLNGLAYIAKVEAQEPRLGRVVR
jgi:hypothetical protein